MLVGSRIEDSWHLRSIRSVATGAKLSERGQWHDPIQSQEEAGTPGRQTAVAGRKSELV
jgi:hypothetical protein